MVNAMVIMDLTEQTEKQPNIVQNKVKSFIDNELKDVSFIMNAPDTPYINNNKITLNFAIDINNVNMIGNIHRKTPHEIKYNIRSRIKNRFREKFKNINNMKVDVDLNSSVN